MDGCSEGSDAPRRLNAERKQGVLNVCIRSFVITLVAGMSLMTATAQAQETAQSAAAGATPAASQQRTPPIAVIDLGFILRNHPTMKQEIERIKAQTEAEGAKFEQKRQAILKQMEELRENFTEGTADYQAKEKEIANADTQFRLDVVRKNKEFDDARAQIFFEVHRQVTHIVKFYCDHTGACMVLKVARDKPDPKKPETIELAMGQEVFFHQNVDITDWVLQELKKMAPQTTQAQGAVNTAGRPATGTTR